MDEQSQAETDFYIVARFAEWAGDFDYSRTLYTKVGRGKEYDFVPEKFDGPTDIIGFVSSLRATQLSEPALRQSRALVSNKSTLEPEDAKFTASESRQLLSTTNLRAVVHRIGVRDFEMRAYLTDPNYERQLYEIASKLAEQRLSPVQSDSSQTKSAYISPGGEWVIEGVLFQKVTVSDFGLIKSDGRWTRNELPREAKEVLTPFQELLKTLDPPQTTKMR